MPRRREVVAGLCLAALAGPAAAHHGWAWAEDEEFSLTGVIRAARLGNPPRRARRRGGGRPLDRRDRPALAQRARGIDRGPALRRNRGDARGPPLARPGPPSDEGRAGDHRRQAPRPLSGTQLSAWRSSRAAIEASDIAGLLRRSRWSYPAVNTLHVLGVALLLGCDHPHGPAPDRGVAARHPPRHGAPPAPPGRGRRRLPRDPDRRPALRRPGHRLCRPAALRRQDGAGRAGLAHALAWAREARGRPSPSASGWRAAFSLAIVDRGARLRAHARVLVGPGLARKRHMWSIFP